MDLRRFILSLCSFFIAFAAHARLDAAKVREAATAAWGERASTHRALVDYKVCSSAKECFEKDCEKTRATSKNFEDFKSASRPFVMPAASGKPVKGTVMLAHGLSDSPYVWATIAEDLSKQGYNVVTTLMSGHGADRPNIQAATMENWREDFGNGVKLARKLFPGTPLSLGGFSTGGGLAVDYLQKNPKEQNEVANLLLFDPAVRLDKKAPFFLDRPGARKRAAMDLADRIRGVESDAYPSQFNPSWRNMQQVFRLTRSIQIPGQTVSTPTITIFSNGDSRDGSGVLHTPGAHSLLFGREGDPGVLAGDRKMVDLAIRQRRNDVPSRITEQGPIRHTTPRAITHSEVTMREAHANCKVAENTVNPRYDEMMNQVTAFMQAPRAGQPKPGLARSVPRE